MFEIKLSDLKWKWIYNKKIYKVLDYFPINYWKTNSKVLTVAKVEETKIQEPKELKLKRKTWKRLCASQILKKELKNSNSSREKFYIRYLLEKNKIGTSFANILL